MVDWNNQKIKMNLGKNGLIGTIGNLLNHYD
jgi:hypothetical protein